MFTSRKRARVGSALVAGTKTKLELAQTLVDLHANGMLNHDGNVNLTTMRRHLRLAGERHTTAKTPYGPVIQSLDLGPSLRAWEYCNPFAYLWYSCTLSPAFAAIMRDCCIDGRPCPLIIYVDEVEPGNPFRHERTRTLQCVYWAFSNWPQWLLQRTAAWPTFGVLRSSKLEDIEGGLSFLMGKILQVFFAEQGQSFSRGILVDISADSAIVVTAVFKGFLADLTAHKYILDWKGCSGRKCCLECANLNNPARPGDGIGLACNDPDSFHRLTSDDIHELVDELVVAAGRLRPSALARLETDVGFNHRPNGILLNMGLRRIYRPVEHCLRDWMHVIPGDGVGNSNVAAVLYELQPLGITTELVQEFSLLCHIPSRLGRVSKAWFSPTRLRNTTIASFASNILTMIPILYLFLHEFGCFETIPEVCRCFELLYWICALLQRGPQDAMKHADRLRQLVIDYHGLFARLHPAYMKPKLHHLHHVVDTMLRLGACLSCFVLERKHRSIKAAALYVFREVEHTTLTTVVNRVCEQICAGHDLYTSTFLVRPTLHSFGDLSFSRSLNAVLRCGELHSGDVVYLRDDTVGKVAAFWAAAHTPSDIVIELLRYSSLHCEPNTRIMADPVKHFAPHDAVVDVLIWFEAERGLMRFNVPPAILFD